MNKLTKATLAASLTVLMAGACSDTKQEQIAPGMKCGAGKCGANMFDGNSALAKKKKNILGQMRDNDSRKQCVIDAKTTQVVYDCVREPGGKKLSMKCGTGKCGTTPKQKAAGMKCGAGKCGASMQPTKPEPKKEPAMKCGAGKCGSGM